MDETERNYYLVATLEGAIAAIGKALQKEFSRCYRVYREPYPPLHLTVGVLSFPLDKLEPLEEILAGVVAPFLPLALRTLGESCFPAPFKSINLSVERSRPLSDLSTRVARAVTGAGFSAEPFDHWDYHISLVNCNYAAREWSEAEYQEACRRLARENLRLSGQSRRLELWDPVFPPLRILAAFEKT
jgi:2'-5' RNA ligase